MAANRRKFLKMISALPLAVLAPSAGAAPMASEPSARLLLNRFSIAGFQYYKGPSLISRLRPIDRLRLTREPRNRYDSFAVEIHLGNSKLGYVPRSDKKHISRLLEQGADLECRIYEVDSGKGWIVVRVEVGIIYNQYSKNTYK